MRTIHDCKRNCIVEPKKRTWATGVKTLRKYGHSTSLYPCHSHVMRRPAPSTFDVAMSVHCVPWRTLSASSKVTVMTGMLPKYNSSISGASGGCCPATLPNIAKPRAWADSTFAALISGEQPPIRTNTRDPLDAGGTRSAVQASHSAWPTGVNALPDTLASGGRSDGGAMPCCLACIAKLFKRSSFAKESE